MNHFFKSLFFTLAFPCFFLNSFSAGAITPQRQQASVHDMFKDLTEDQIVALMEEGQREMERIMTTGTKAEQDELMRQIEDTMKNFSEEDFEEINKIAKVVEPLLLEKEAEAFKAEESKIIKAEPVKSVPKKDVVMSGDASFEYMLHKINKTINGILLKVKSDTLLTDTLKNWNNKDSFNELVRLLQALNNKNLIAKLTSATTDDIKKLVETIENFSKRLEIENKQFTVADSFGLEVDKATSLENAKKLNKILEFFTGATETLLPMVTKFIQEFEPEALLLVKAHDDKAKASLDAAKQIEKQKRPIGAYTGSSYVPSDGSSSYNQQGNYNPSRGDYGSSHQNYTSAPQNRRVQNKMNADGGAGNGASSQGAIPGAPKSPADKDVKKEDNKDKKDADKKADALKPIIDKIERFDDVFDNNAFDDYRKALTTAGDTYKSFGKELALPIQESDYETFLNPQFRGPLTIAQSNLKSSYQAKAADFKKATQAAHTHYGSLKASIDTIAPQIKDLRSIVETTRGSLAQLNLADLEKLNTSNALKKLKARFQAYEGSFNNVQKELNNKHKAHKIETGNPDEVRAYNELQAKVESLHGLDRLIIDTRASFDLLDRSIKGEIKHRKRNAGKA